MVTGKYKNWELYEVKSKSASSPFSLHMALFICCRVSLCRNIFSLYIYNIPEFLHKYNHIIQTFLEKCPLSVFCGCASILWFSLLFLVPVQYTLYVYCMNVLKFIEPGPCWRPLMFALHLLLLFFYIFVSI